MISKEVIQSLDISDAIVKIENDLDIIIAKSASRGWDAVRISLREYGLGIVLKVQQRVKDAGFFVTRDPGRDYLLTISWFDGDQDIAECYPDIITID